MPKYYNQWLKIVFAKNLFSKMKEHHYKLAEQPPTTFFMVDGWDGDGLKTVLCTVLIITKMNWHTL